MSDNVITPAFGRKPDEPDSEPRIWTCVCGCQDFELYEDNSTRCSLCGTVGLGHLFEIAQSDGEPPSAIRTSVNHGSIDLAKKSVLRDADDGDTMILMIARRDGVVRLWTKSDELTTDEQKRWIRSRFDAAASLAVGEPREFKDMEGHPA